MIDYLPEPHPPNNPILKGVIEFFFIFHNFISPIFFYYILYITSGNFLRSFFLLRAKDQYDLLPFLLFSIFCFYFHPCNLGKCHFIRTILRNTELLSVSSDFEFWRRVRDSNPRSFFKDDSLVNCCYRPLSQLSINVNSSILV